MAKLEDARIVSRGAPQRERKSMDPYTVGLKVIPTTEHTEERCYCTMCICNAPPAGAAPDQNLLVHHTLRGYGDRTAIHGVVCACLKSTAGTCSCGGEWNRCFAVSAETHLLSTSHREQCFYTNVIEVIPDPCLYFLHRITNWSPLLHESRAI